jgi:tetratricopeptide (TPR) repeat protein
MRCGKRITVPGGAAEPDLASQRDDDKQGKLLEKSGRKDDAITVYETSLKSKSTSPHPYNRLRIIYTKDRNFKKAIRVCEAAIENIDDPKIDHAAEGKFVEHIEKLREKIEREARTIAEHTRRMRETEKRKYSEAKKRGSKRKIIITASDELVCDRCELNEALGWIPIDHPFQKGKAHPPIHPGCRCTATYRTFPPSEFDTTRAREASEETKAAKAGKK